MTTSPPLREECDVVVVGCRVAGSSTAIEFARLGNEVIAIDATTFPSDTLSTHLIFPGCVAQIKALGALDKLLATGTPTMNHAIVNHGGEDAHGTYSPVDGIDYAMCPRRTTLDSVLVDEARQRGVDVREATKAEHLIWDAGRVVGIGWSDRQGRTGQIRAKLVVGADGRRSTISSLLGVAKPYREAENGRGLVFMYVDDPREGDARSIVYQWRVGTSLAMYFPTDDNCGLVLLMGPKDEVDSFGQDLSQWKRALTSFPALVERIGDGEPRSRLRKASDTRSYFRRSSGPGWALVGDAAQFKDPVIAQGIYDAIVHARRLATVAAEVLDSPLDLDHALHGWELDRDRDCLSAYYWGLRFTDTTPITPLEVEAFKSVASDRKITREWMDVYSRRHGVEQFMTYRRQLTWLGRALSGGADSRQTFRQASQMMITDFDRHRDRARLRLGRRIRPTPSDPWIGAADGSLT
ncbi:MAG: NAD(P)/FAD-dependent oxidoreductase [Acidimicrobiales bacterium]